MKGRRFESIHNMEVARTAQLQTPRKEASGAAAGSGLDDGMSVLRMKGDVLKEVMAMCLLLQYSLFYLNISCVVFNYTSCSPCLIELLFDVCVRFFYFL